MQKQKITQRPETLNLIIIYQLQAPYQQCLLYLKKQKFKEIWTENDLRKSTADLEKNQAQFLN